MSLSSALNIAQNALAATSRQTSVVSRNVSGASDPDYARRTAVVSSEAPGTRALVIQRAANEMLFRQNLAAAAASGGQGAIAEGMERLGLSVNGVDGASSAATALGKLQEALQTYSAAPSNRTLAETAVSAAGDLARTLNAGSNAVGAFRTQTDAAIGTAVDDLRNLLQSFGDANSAVMTATRTGRDASDALDTRDAALKKIAGYVPVSTLTRAGGDMVITTADGATLFETVPRAISFSSSNTMDTATPGSRVLVDGVPLGGGANGSGRITGLLHLRDDVSTAVGAQLDEVARGLVAAFAETDRTGGAAPALAGLFTWPGGPALPADGTVSAGLAGRIGVNALFDSSKGGDAQRLRDGGANGAAYKANTGGNASFSALLIGYGDALDQPIGIDPDAGLGSQASVADLSAGAVGWFEAIRKTASEKAEQASALSSRTAEALSNETGVNVDTEYALLLDLEHAYQASARIIKTVDEMLTTLMNAVN